jgi:hypothetical protein
MFLYVEMWKAKPEWLALPQAERRIFFDEHLPRLQDAPAEGVDLIGIFENPADTPHRQDFDYAAVWRMPDEAAAIHFEESVERAGWHRYFYQRNARGAVMDLKPFLEAHLQETF